MSHEETLEKLYDAGYTNALMQLRSHISQFIDKPNAQTNKVLNLITVMLDVNQEKKA
jgi:DNA topoisomerase IB